MYKVFLAISKAPDQLLGYVNEAGVIFRTKVGFDDRLGEVNLASGKVYSDRLGPDKQVGYVDPKSGKVYLSKFGPDEYFGRVNADGSMHLHVPMGTDQYIGKINPFVSFAFSAGAMLLLVLPAIEEKRLNEEPRPETPDQAEDKSE